MLAGHVAVGFLGKRIAPSLSLGTAVTAALAADLLWGIFLISGIESFEILRRGPTLMQSEVVTQIAWSHSLAMDALWAILGAGAYFLLRRDWRGTWVVFGAVLSHWLLDFASHGPDMPLLPGSTRVFGLGLWASIPATLVVEGGLWIFAVLAYLRATHSEKRGAPYALWIGFAVITLAWYNNIAGPPPTVDSRIGGISSLLFFSLISAWGFWVNRLRPVAVGISNTL